ncbi:Rrf2 family transcriptional regulator [Mobilitalea sibirica]|uniref:Rrf2 family transcriptional regulator n=1 Tax=Mobilitalea sibirica TaxID=1462919 RepID=A0A8J7H2C6_9FIRM|nr:Rrf2 family transcriptional regulator [Mobilitalea sibirica]MBH1940620.1 Rrf2 family transcriptional regulator [Mobilitalea sibirica]
MKISSKGRYGLRAMIDLILNSNNEQEHVSLISIAQRQDLSKNYLEQVFAILRKTGIVKSVKGAQGGYILAKASSEITVGDVLRALEGDMSVYDEEESRLINNKIENCIRNNIWNRLDEKIIEIIDGITLEDIVNEYKRGEDMVMYYI